MLFDTERLELTIIELKHNTYAINTNNIVEAIVNLPLTKLANQPAHLRGLANIRGEIIPVIDLQYLLEQKHTDSNVYLVINKPNRYKLACAVNNITDVFDIDIKTISPPPQTACMPDYYKGFIQSQGKTITILETDLLIKWFNI